MNIDNIRNFKKHIILYTSLILLLMALIQNANAQLEVFDRNPNYLTYNGEVIFLVCSVPLYTDFHVEDFILDHITDMKEYGANHIWIIIENYTRQPWTYVKDTPAKFWQKMEQIVSTAYDNDVIVGISLYGYGLVKYPYMYSFNAACTGQCLYDSGPLADPWDFYDVNNNEPDVVEARNIQEYILRKIVDYTWDYPNVYYSPGWEINCIWNSNVAQWFRWCVDYMKDYGKQVNANVSHLFAIERTTTPMEAYELGADFIIEEDGNAQKVDGLPFVYWSMDGMYRGLPFWNGDDEPRYDWNNTREQFINGCAGIATQWGIDPEEEDFLQSIATFASTVENWIDEPGQEIIDSAVPATWSDSGVDIAGSDALDYVDYSSFEISEISASSGNPFVPEYSVTVGATAYYTDRTYGLYYIPPDYQGLVWLKTPNDDKRLEAETYLSYHINSEATIFVGYDSRLTNNRPAWLSDWTSAGVNVVDETGVEFELFFKNFPAGKVQLGANYGGDSSCSMYIILHKPTGVADQSPPAIPSNVTLTPLFE